MKHALILFAALFLPAACASTEEASSPDDSLHARGSVTAGNPYTPLVFTAQAGWIAEEPESAMRKAQYRLTNEEGDFEHASLVVYHFGESAGSAEENIERWCGQFEQSDGRLSSEVATRSVREIAGMTVHELRLGGRYVAETSPGSGEYLRKEDWLLLAAIVETKHGPYYVKLVGPAPTVERWEASYHAFLDSIH